MNTRGVARYSINGIGPMLCPPADAATYRAVKIQNKRALARCWGSPYSAAPVTAKASATRTSLLTDIAEKRQYGATAQQTMTTVAAPYTDHRTIDVRRSRAPASRLM